MMDFTDARKLAFEYNSKNNPIKILSPEEKLELGITFPYEVWELETEIELTNNRQETILLYITFDFDFPLSFPKIYLSEEFYERSKYLPHVTNRNICVVDPDFSSANFEAPHITVKKCIELAKKILQDGLKGGNLKDFEDEFLSYWEHQYHNEEQLVRRSYSILNGPITGRNVGVVYYQDKFGLFSFFVHNYNDEYTQLKENLKNIGITAVDYPAFYLGTWQLEKPPFHIEYKQIIELTKSKGSDIFREFKKFINKSDFPKFLFFSRTIKDIEYLFGLVVGTLDTNRAGFQPNHLKHFDIMASFDSHKLAQRMLPVNIASKRLSMRTEGKIDEKEGFDVVIAGIGSVGSNLIHFLNSLKIDNYNLIDFDDLNIDNIGRHLLGFFSTGLNKALAMRDHILLRSPLQKISTRTSSIVNVVVKEPQLLNEADFIFIAIGKFNQESWINEQVKLGILKKPIFYLWVEPYLAGGHVLYVHPEDNRFMQYFDSNTMYKYNIISNESYEKQESLLKLQEAGCNTTYTPYSAESVISFLAAVFPSIKYTMHNSEKKSWCLSWIGDTEIVTKLGIQLSGIGLKNRPGQLLIY